MTPIDLSIIVPCRNEEDAVVDTVTALQRAASALELAPRLWEVVVVDDASTDRTPQVLRDVAGVRVIRHEAQRGYGASIKSGLRQARGEWVAIIDADGTYPADRLGELLQWTGEADMVVAARRPQGTARLDYRRPFRDLYRRYGSWLVGRDVPDLNSGFRVFRRDLAQAVAPLLPDGFSLTSTITIAFMRQGREVRYVPMPYHPRVGRSKINPFIDWMRFVQLIVRTGLYFAPWRVFGPFIVLAWLSFAGCLAYDGLALRDLTDKTLLSLVAAVGLTLLAVLADVVSKRG